MKKTIITLFLTALLASFAACSKDSFTEAEDPTPNPETIAEICDNGTDDDGDTLIDCDDTDCTSTTACIATDIDPEVVEVCNDGADNDNDTLIDCYDADCNSDDTICGGADVTETVCTDATDNDGDGLSDCDDTDCAADSSCTGGGEGTNSNLSSDYVYTDFDPADTSLSVLYVKVDGTNVNSDGTANTTCGIDNPCTLRYALEDLTTTNPKVIALFEGVYPIGHHQVEITSAVKIYGGFYIDADGKLAANYATHPSHLRFKHNGYVLINSGANEVLVDGVSIEAFPAKGGLKIINSSPTLSHLKIKIKEGHRYVTAVSILNDSTESYAPIIENSIISVGKVLADATGDTLSNAVTLLNSSTGTLSPTFTHNVINSETLQVPAATYETYAINVLGINAAGGQLNLTFSENNIVLAQSDFATGLIAGNVTSATFANNKFILQGHKYTTASGMTLSADGTSGGTATLYNNLVAFANPAAAPNHDFTMGIVTNNLSVTAYNNSIVTGFAAVSLGVDFVKQPTASFVPSYAFSNNYIGTYQSGTSLSVSTVFSGSTPSNFTAFNNNYFVNANASMSYVFLDDSGYYADATTTDTYLQSINASLTATDVSTTDGAIALTDVRFINHRFVFSLETGSPLIDAGAAVDSFTDTSVDVYGKPRLNGGVDIGAVEYQ